MNEGMIVRFPMAEHPDNLGICGCGCGQELDTTGQAFVIDAINGNEMTVTVWRLECLGGKASTVPNATLRYIPNEERWVIGPIIPLFQRNGLV
jgi:hypothetical protein